MPSLREQLQDTLAPLLPGWRIVPNISAVDTSLETVAQFFHTRIDPGPTQGTAIHTLTATIRSSITDAERVEDDLDEGFAQFIAAVLQNPTWITFSGATKAQASEDAPPQWTVDLSILTPMPTPSTPEPDSEPDDEEE